MRKADIRKSWAGDAPLGMAGVWVTAKVPKDYKLKVGDILSDIQVSHNLGRVPEGMLISDGLPIKKGTQSWNSHYIYIVASSDDFDVKIYLY